MRKISIGICIVLFFVFVFSGCKKEESYESPYNEETPVEGEIVIKTVNVTEQPLSEVETDESDWFANNFNIYQPYIDENGGMYYNVTGSGDGSYPQYLHYDNGVDEPINLGLPDANYFNVGITQNDVVYGMEYDYDGGGYYYLTKYQDGTGERLFDTEVYGCYFAEEGIYYQNYNKIYLMDYNGENAKLIVRIPDELYYQAVSSKFIVYRGMLWYCYDDFFHEYPYPLWCYDFNGTFTKFDNGGLDAVNNGYLYYQTHNSSNLYRFNCETHCIELVSDAEYINGCSFANNYVLYTAWNEESNTDNLYRINNRETTRILTPDKLSHSEGVLKVSCCRNRIFATGYAGMIYTCLAEIDIDGNVLEIIHEDKYW